MILQTFVAITLKLLAFEILMFTCYQAHNNTDDNVW